MKPSYRVLRGEELCSSARNRRFALDVLTGLSEQPKSLPSRYFYDARGSQLFARICDLDSYYLTRCEAEILTEQGDRLIEALGGEPINLVDLGAGDGRKTYILLRHLLRTGQDVTLVPIDISEAAMQVLMADVEVLFPALSVQGIVGEYFEGLHTLRNMRDRRNLVLLLGSNLGNFTQSQARFFLRRLWEALNPNDLLLIGFDLKKDIDVLMAAYDDPEKLTAAFNVNLLHRINRELGGHLDPDRFRHYATYNVSRGAMESYLVSLEDQEVVVDALHRSFTFSAWEPIHVEYSYKYLEEDIAALCGATGFTSELVLYDARGWFTDRLWRVEKTNVAACG